jgi:hypothetical protein
MNVSRINLNADLGESFGAWQMGNDAELLRIVGAANIACGFHAGDPLVMRRTVMQALAAGVSLGAHPSFPDRRVSAGGSMQLPAAELEAMLIYQIGALAGIAQAEGGRLTHVKPHGALNNMACEDPALASSVVAAIRSFDASLILLAPALSKLALAGADAGCASRPRFLPTAPILAPAIWCAQPARRGPAYGRRMRRACPADARRGRPRQRRRAGHPDRIPQHLRAWRRTAGGRRGDRHSRRAAGFGSQPLPLPASPEPAADADLSPAIV